LFAAPADYIKAAGLGMSSRGPCQRNVQAPGIA
jgi:hypothetical protein